MRFRNPLEGIMMGTVTRWSYLKIVAFRKARAWLAICVAGWLVMSTWPAGVVLAEPPTSLPAPLNADSADKHSDSPSHREPPIRRALIVCGLTGDEEHQKLFQTVVTDLHRGLTKHHGFAPEHVHILWGDERRENIAPLLADVPLTTRTTVLAAAKQLAVDCRPDDAAWVILVGHTHFDGQHAWFNVKDTDLNQTEFGDAFSELKCREQIFWITTASSGYFIKPLSRPERIVVAATEADFEVNRTLFPQFLADALSQPATMDVATNTVARATGADIDQDGQWTLHDVFLSVALAVDEAYLTEELLATEHAILDDNGDGRGTELQLAYLTVERGGQFVPGRGTPALPTADGKRAREIVLTRPRAEITPEFPPAPPLPVTLDHSTSNELTR